MSGPFSFIKPSKSPIVHIEDEYYSSYTQLNAEVQKLSHLKHQTQERQQNLQKQIVAAKDWIVRQPQLQDFTEKLQQYLQQKNVLAFNEMLSGFVEDVLEKDKLIELELYTSHSLPALKIHALNNGFEESIMDGSGGSLANIVSTGLRVIAAARSPNRKFLVLDEADCWIKPERIELFAKVIGEISMKLNMQIVMISHHSSEYFKQYGRVVELKKVGGKIEANIVSDIGMTQDMKERNYIEKLRLQDFMSHEDTHIEFHPNITCIVGENDIGKSAVGACFRAFSRGVSEDGFVKHTKDYARASLDFDHGWQLLWQRNKKLSQTQKHKVFFDLIYQGVSQAQEYNSYETPAFVAERLNIREIEGIDVHLAHQKEPTFLIDNKTRPQDKAKILSLGKESFIVQKMMEKIKEKGKFLKQDLKAQEAAFHENSRVLIELEAVEGMENRLTLIHSVIESLRDHNEQLAQLEKLVAQISHLQSIKELEHLATFDTQSLTLQDTQALSVLVENLAKTQQLKNLGKLKTIQSDFALEDTQRLEELIETFDLNQKLSSLSKLNVFDQSIAISDTQPLAQLIEKMTFNQKLSSIGKLAPQADLPTPKDTQRLRELIERIKNTQAFSHINKSEPLNIDIEQAQEQSQKSLRLAQLLESIKKAQETQQLLQKKKDNSASHFEQLEIDKKAIHAELGGVCPCCGSKISENQLLENHI